MTTQTLEQAQQELTRCQAVAAEAKRVADEANAAIETASAEVQSVTKEIENHDGGPGIENLAAKRAVAVARVDALTSRAKAKVKAHAEARAAVTTASMEVCNLQLADGRQRVADLDGAIKEQIESVAAFIDRAKAEIEVAKAYTSEAGFAVFSAQGRAVLGAFVKSAYDDPDDLIRAFTKALDQPRSARESARNAELERARAEARKLATERAAAAAVAPLQPAVVSDQN